MIETLVLTSVLGSITPPDYVDDFYFETENWSGLFSVKYWEDTDRFKYRVFNSEESEYNITYWEVFNAFTHDYEIEPGEWKTFNIYGNGFGYEDTFGFLYSGYDENSFNFNTIAPSSIPAPGALFLLGLGATVGCRKRRV
tara:strand:- start:1498 stop:1917 length:420 start_codon:yes stop_codon:yes gene_type:complete